MIRENTEVIKEKISEDLVSNLGNESKINSSISFANSNNYDHDLVVGVLKGLESKNIVALTLKQYTELYLTSEGQRTIEKGSPEFILWESIEERLPCDQVATMLGVALDVSKIIVGAGIKLKFYKVDKSNFLIKLQGNPVDQTRIYCQAIARGEQLEKRIIDNLKRRDLIKVKNVKEYEVGCGTNFNDFGKVFETELTEEMISNGSWKTANFKNYNFNSLGIRPLGGELHPLLKIRQEFREIFLQMGFEEMHTHRYVESSFWNFDALFQPQFHPSRDAHDTFFVKDPSKTTFIPEDYKNRVKNVHESGGYDSIGYRYKWNEDESLKNVLRTHTTASSARILYDLAQEYKKTGKFVPKKYFSIDRVFRNEATDQTHLAEFHQCEGIIIDRNISLRDLIGLLSSYFARQGLKDLKFKPAYNPYTEPSLEIFAYHKAIGKLVEIGNSGVFRPEMLRPMGFPPDVRALGWGVSLERPAMIKYDIKDIRHLIGHEIPYEFIRKNPICRIDR